MIIKKELIGYRIKPEFEKFYHTIAEIAVKRFSCAGTSILRDCDMIFLEGDAEENLLVSGLLELWLEPVYKKEKNQWEFTGDVEKISSVRCNDVLYSLGDRIFYRPDRPFIIDNFLLRSDNVMLVRGKNDNPVEDITTIKKCKPLFVTEDGSPIYDGDIYYGVDSANWRCRPFTALKDGGYRGIWTFSTRSAAKKYIYDNEKVFSRKEIVNAEVPIEPMSNVARFILTNKMWIDKSKLGL